MTPLQPGQVAEALTGAICEALSCWAETSGDAPISRCGMVPGLAVAADECCGQVTATFSQAFLTNNFPEELSNRRYDPAGATVAAEFSFQLLRCVPGVSDNGSAPSAAELATAGARLAAEGVVMWSALNEMLVAMYQDEGYVLGPLVATGPDGRCAGYSTTVTIDLGDLCAPPACE